MADTNSERAMPNDPSPIVPPGLRHADQSTTPGTAGTTGTRRERSEHCLRRVVVAIHAAVHLAAIPRDVDGQKGQSTVEYALILLGAAAIALALVSWVTGSNVVGRLFDTVIDRILGRV